MSIFGTVLSCMPQSRIGSPDLPGRACCALHRRERLRRQIERGHLMQRTVSIIHHPSTETPCDQKLHDLVGAGIDTHHPRVAIHTRDRKFLHAAIAAEELQAAINDLSLQVSQPIFGHRCRDRIERAIKIALDAMVVKHPRDGRLRFAFGEPELSILEFNYLLTEGLSLLDVLDRKSKRALNHSLGMDRDNETLARKIVHELCEALTFLATEQVLRRQFPVLEEQFGGVGGIKPSFLSLRPRRKPGASSVSTTI